MKKENAVNLEDYIDEHDIDTSNGSLLLPTYNISTSPNDFNIITIFNLINNGIVKLPTFQRNFVWDIKRASKLIESIIMGLPIPQIYLYEKDKNEFLIIDGQQRLLSIFFFIKQRFPKDFGRLEIRKSLLNNGIITDELLNDDKLFRGFKLILPLDVFPKQNSQYNGIKYSTLNQEKSTFEYLRTIRCMVIKQNEPDDGDSSMFEIFSRLNTGGQNLSVQEIRMCLYQSKFLNNLIIMNENDNWKRLLGARKPIINLTDVEILLRVFAMLHENRNYNPSMKKFLNSFAMQSRIYDKEPHKIEYFNALFYRFIENCSELTPNSFTLVPNKFSISLFESVFVSVCEAAFLRGDLNIAPVTEKMIQTLKLDTEFSNSLRKDPTSAASVSIRISRAKAIIIG
jgi:uncharacterized protein with ParB-like and HNH nuclease domain